MGKILGWDRRMLDYCKQAFLAFGWEDNAVKRSVGHGGPAREVPEEDQ